MSAVQRRRLLMSRSSLLCAALLLQLVYEVAVCNDAFPLAALDGSDAVKLRCCVYGCNCCFCSRLSLLLQVASVLLR